MRKSWSRFDGVSPLSLDEARQQYRYNPDTGVVVRIRDHFIPGSKSKKKRARKGIKINGRDFILTHLIWFLVKEHWPTKDEEIDHRDRDFTNEKFENLRLTGRQGNCLNRGKFKSAKESKYIGVRKRGTLWEARLKDLSGVTHSLGKFSEEIDAARARDKLAVELLGDIASLNFPEEYNEKR